MALYRSVQVEFWQDKFIRGLSPEERYFYLYLITNPRTTQCGVYEFNHKIAEAETGYSMDTVSILLRRFADYAKIEFDPDTQEILVRNWIPYNYSKSPKVLACIKKEASGIKSVRLRESLDTLCIQYGYSMDTASQEKEKEKEKEKEQQTEKGDARMSSICKQWEGTFGILNADIHQGLYGVLLALDRAIGKLGLAEQKMSAEDIVMEEIASAYENRAKIKATPIAYTIGTIKKKARDELGCELE